MKSLSNTFKYMTVGSEASVFDLESSALTTRLLPADFLLPYLDCEFEYLCYLLTPGPSKDIQCH